MTGPSNLKIDRIVDQLSDERNSGLALLAFGQSIVGNEARYAKISGSYSGHIARLQINCTLKETRLWCARVWDRTGHSLPVLAKQIDGRWPDIIAARRAAHPDWDDEYLIEPGNSCPLDDFVCNVKDLAGSDLIAGIRIYRDEYFAHLLAGVSGARRKADQTQIDTKYCYDDVFKLVRQSCDLISEAVRLWRFEVHSSEACLRIYESYCNSYWDALPVFTEVEKHV